MKRSLLPILSVAVCACLAVQGEARGGGSRWAPKPRDIQAVCRIEMKRGPDIEGVIVIGREYPYYGGRYWDANGFYFASDDGSSSAILFDKYWEYIKNGEITELDPVYNGIPSRLRPKPKEVIAWPEHDRVHFLSARASDDYNETETGAFTASIDSSARPFVYRSEFVERFSTEYDLLDYIPVYPKIPDEVAVRGAKSVKPIHVLLRDIREFRVLLRLSEKWAYDVDAARKRGERAHACVRWFNYYSLPEFRSETLYSPWENFIPPDSSRIGVDHPHTIKPFDLQAICHIETVDSQVVEGAVLIARDVRPDEACENLPETNGFFFTDDMEKKEPFRGTEVCLMPVDYDTWSSDSNRCITAALEGSSWCSSSPGAKNYYLKDVTVEKYGKGRLREVKSEIAREGSGLVLKRYVENRYPGVFEMLDCIPVYTEIPGDRLLRAATSVQPVCVPVSNIREFRIVRFPAVLWWTRIERAESEAKKAGIYREDVRWFLGARIQGVSMSWIKPTFIYHSPRHPGLDLSNIWGY